MQPRACWALLAIGLFWSPAAFCADSAKALQQESPGSLSARIDQLIEEGAIGPLAPLCSDADFVRRAYLDLVGVIPTADEARAFIADQDINKRRALIDKLLASPDFLRHMTVVLDVLLMERKAEKVIKQPEWEAYLYQSLAADKPLDRLISEMIASDGADTRLRPAARFVLDRDAEPNLLTRDIGRLVFGMDLQCCQCHDHPLVDDYYQEDYYGLFAFVQRTTLFTDAKTKQVSLTEKADGEASFKSVFTGAASDKAQPRLPKDRLLLEEPVFAKGEEYQVKPDKTVRGVPKFSRRAALAERVGDSHEFSRNVANRLWAHLFGRGLVHPLDFHHADNPPSHPELLTLLADRLAAGGYQLRPFLRELTQSRTYSRSCDAPRPETVNFADVAARLEQLERDKQRQSEAIGPLEKSLTSAREAFKASREEYSRAVAQLAKLEAEFASRQQEHQKVIALGKAADAAATKADEQSAALRQAADALAKLAADLSADKALAEAAAVVAARATDLEAAALVAQQAAKTQATAEQAVAKSLADAQRARDLATTAKPDMSAIEALEQQQLTAEHKLADARYRTKSIEQRITTARKLLECQTLQASAPEKAEAAWSALVEQWTIAGQIGALKPLTPEQLAASAMQAAGMLASQRSAAEAKLTKSPPDELKNAPAAEQEAVRSRLRELEVLNQLRNTYREFVRLYGGEPGQEFQATVNQALFFGNGTMVDGWLKPAGDNLVEKLVKADTNHLAEDLYWAVFSRPASEAEKLEVIEYVAQRQKDKAAAIAEMTWALLGSTEFRFNH